MCVIANEGMIQDGDEQDYHDFHHHGFGAAHHCRHFQQVQAMRV
jgi:hypothetical protein